MKLTRLFSEDEKMNKICSVEHKIVIRKNAIFIKVLKSALRLLLIRQH